MHDESRWPTAKRLEIVVPGNYIDRRPNGTAKEKVTVNNIRWQGAGVDYLNRLLYSTKCAMEEQGWELTDKPIYMAIIIYCKPTHEIAKRFKQMKKLQQKQTLITVQRPSIESLMRQHIYTLQKLVFKKPSQITASFVLRLYDDEPRTEIIFGQPETVKELLHDIRNI